MKPTGLSLKSIIVAGLLVFSISCNIASISTKSVTRIQGDNQTPIVKEGFQTKKYTYDGQGNPVSAVATVGISLLLPHSKMALSQLKRPETQMVRLSRKINTMRRDFKHPSLPAITFMRKNMTR